MYLCCALIINKLSICVLHCLYAQELNICADLLILRWFYKAINMAFACSLMKNDMDKQCMHVFDSSMHIKVFSLIQESLLALYRIKITKYFVSRHIAAYIKLIIKRVWSDSLINITCVHATLTSSYNGVNEIVWHTTPSKM